MLSQRYTSIDLTFQSRAHVGARRPNNLCFVTAPFQSTAPALGRDTRHNRGSYSIIPVSIHAPTWGATRCTRYLPLVAISFNPRAHVEARLAPFRLIKSITGSIHARPRGARPLITMFCTHQFQSTRPRGARPGSPQTAREVAFQSTRPRGRDATRKYIQHHYFAFQSTRTWGRDAMKRSGGAIWTLRCFQKSTRARGGATLSLGWVVPLRFNPRAHVGRRRHALAAKFQSRAHVGRDEKSITMDIGTKQFQSTRARGARQGPVSESAKTRSFNHAPTWGATGSHTAIASFNPRAPALRRDARCVTVVTSLILVSIRARGRAR